MKIQKILLIAVMLAISFVGYSPAGFFADTASATANVEKPVVSVNQNQNDVCVERKFRALPLTVKTAKKRKARNAPAKAGFTGGKRSVYKADFG